MPSSDEGRMMIRYELPPGTSLQASLDFLAIIEAWTMEQPWPQLGNWRFPVELKVGKNWGEYDATSNPKGLTDVPYRPLTAAYP